MRIKEITNAEDQLNLLRVIFNNTWGAIEQEANVQARQKAAQANKPKAKGVKAPKRAPYAPVPKPLPRPVIQQPAPSQKQLVVSPVKQMPSNSVPQRSPEEIKAFQDYLRGEKTKPL